MVKASWVPMEKVEAALGFALGFADILALEGEEVWPQEMAQRPLPQLAKAHMPVAA